MTHVDLLEVLPGKPVKVELPLRTTGQAIGVMNGGRLELNYRRVPVRGLVDQLPECLTVDITPLKIGTTPVCVTSKSKASTFSSAKAPWWLASAPVRPCLPNLRLKAKKVLKAEGGEAAEGGEGYSQHEIPHRRTGQPRLGV